MPTELKKFQDNGCYGAHSWYTGAVVKAGIKTGPEAHGCTRCPKLDGCMFETRAKVKALFPLLFARFQADVKVGGYEGASRAMLAATKGQISDPISHTCHENWRDGMSGNEPGTYYKEMGSV